MNWSFDLRAIAAGTRHSGPAVSCGDKVVGDVGSPYPRTPPDGDLDGGGCGGRRAASTEPTLSMSVRQSQTLSARHSLRPSLNIEFGENVLYM